MKDILQLSFLVGVMDKVSAVMGSIKSALKWGLITMAILSAFVFIAAPTLFGWVFVGKASIAMILFFSVLAAFVSIVADMLTYVRMKAVRDAAQSTPASAAATSA